MAFVACIVEGQGDVASIPIIVRRIAEREGVLDLRVLRPFRIPRHTIVRAGELERAVERAARSISGTGGVLVVLDAADDPPCQLGPRLAARAAAARPDIVSAVVIANRGERGLVSGGDRIASGEERHRPRCGAASRCGGSPRGQGLARIMGRSYSEVTDEPALAALFDLDLAWQNAPSFEKLWREVHRLLAVANA